MKKKKNWKMIYPAVFFAMCTIPVLLYPVAANNTLTDNRPIAEMPMLVSEGSLNTDFASDCEEWLRDHAPFRSAAVTAANIVKSGIFKSGASGVITGKKGWIFDEETVPDYINSNALSDARLQSMAVSLSLIEENVTEKGGSFLFVPVADKASVYSEFMPSGYKKAEENNLTRLQKQLSAYDVSYIDMLALMTGKKSYSVYHQRDTRWNYYGALLAYYGITDALGKNHKMYNDTDYIPKKNWKGNLDQKLYPLGIFRDYQYNLNLQYDPYVFVYPAGVTDTQAQLEYFMSDGSDDARIETQKTEALGNGSLYMLRDSFGKALLPFFIDNYDTTLIVQSDYPDMNNVNEGTDMVYEIAEKDISSLFRTAPVMKAPVREDINEGAAASETVDFEWSEEECGIRIYGELKSSMLSDDGRIYVKLSGSGKSVVYEAFPVYEAERLGGEGERYGFSFIPDTSYLKAGEYDVTVICGDKSYSALSVNPLEFSEDSIDIPEGEEEEAAEEMPEEEEAVQEAFWVDGEFSDRAAVVYKGVTLALGDDITELTEDLGEEAVTSSEESEEGYEEAVTEYYYPGMTVHTTEDGIICSIEITESLHKGREVSTAGGLQCGSVKADIIAAFGDPEVYDDDEDYEEEEAEENEESENSDLIYEEDGIRVQISFNGKKVTAVLIALADEEY